MGLDDEDVVVVRTFVRADHLADPDPTHPDRALEADAEAHRGALLGEGCLCSLPSLEGAAEVGGLVVDESHLIPRELRYSCVTGVCS